MNQSIVKQLDLLKPGDIILQEGGDPISQHVKRLSQGNYSHARIYVGKDQTGKHTTIEILTKGIIEQELFEGFKKLKAIKFSVFRHQEITKYPNKIEKLLEIARNYKEKSCYASINQIELTSKILVYDFFARKTSNPELLRKIYEKYFHILVRARKDNLKLFTCSGFIYQVFFDADFPIYSNRFDFAPNYRSNDHDEVASFINLINDIAQHSTNEDSFFEKLNSQKILGKEISNDEFENLLLDDELFGLQDLQEQNKNYDSHRGIKRDIKKIERATKKKYIKLLETHTLFYLLLADSLYKPFYIKKLNNDDLEPSKSLLEIFRSPDNFKNKELSDHIFFGVSDIATSSSLEPVLHNILLP